MDFAFTEEQRQLRDLVRSFAEKELAPEVARNDEESRFPAEQIRKLGELGLMGVTVPAEYGGAGMDTVSYAIVMEEISRVDASAAVVLSVNNSLVCEVLKTYGTGEQKKKYLPPLARGEKLGAYCLTEPMSGSDAGTQKTTAKKREGRYVIDGAKNWITNGPQADLFVVFATTAPEKKTKGISAFLVERSTPGLEIGKEENKLGIRGSGTCSIAFGGAEVPQENRIGAEGEGYKIALASLDGGRIGIAAQALGISQAAFEAAVAYAKERKQFGKALAEFQGIRWMLADMATKIDAARLLVYQAAWRKSRGGRFTKYSAMAKLFASEVSSRVTNKALQIHGGYGFTKDYPLERYLRDARITEIYEGTSEIQRLVIAGLVLKEAAAAI